MRSTAPTGKNRPPTGDHQYIACSGSYNQIIAAPQKNGSLFSLAFDDLKMIYTRPNPNAPGSVQYRNLYAFDQEVYALLGDDRVFRLNESGLIEINFSLQDPYVPYLAEKLSNDNLVVAARQEAKDEWRLFIVNKINGFVERQVFVKSAVKALGVAKDGDILFSYSFNDNAVIARYNRDSRLTTELYFVPGEVPVDMLVENGIGYLATYKKLYNFDPEIPGNVVERFDLKVSSLAYDDVNGQVYLASENLVYRTALNGGPNIYVVGVADPVYDIAVMYNK